jgi:hypothetical protein
MSSSTVSFRRFIAAVCATAITAVGAWGFATSSASVGRDPFHFGETMAANAKARAALFAREGSRLPTET